MNDKPHYILEKFRENSQIIAHLMEEDGEFLALCEDYDACVNALRYWAKSKEPEAEARVHEYRSLVQELEEEISQALAALEPRGLD
jgi:crotonobetainyl-CoA:carnitine CoA-transferase CaiB-like acyl-CoA transferase